MKKARSFLPPIESQVNGELPIELNALSRNTVSPRELLGPVETSSSNSVPGGVVISSGELYDDSDLFIVTQILTSDKDNLKNMLGVKAELEREEMIKALFSSSAFSKDLFKA